MYLFIYLLWCFTIIVFSYLFIHLVFLLVLVLFIVFLVFVRQVNMLVIVIVNVKNKEIKNCSITKKKKKYAHMPN